MAARRDITQRCSRANQTVALELRHVGAAPSPDIGLSPGSGPSVSAGSSASPEPITQVGSGLLSVHVSARVGRCRRVRQPSRIRPVEIEIAGFARGRALAAGLA